MIHREKEIIQWGLDRNIIGLLSQSNKDKQLTKTYEEVDELSDAITDEEYENPKARDNARDAIGDIIVTLVLQAQMWGLDLTECIEAAWLEIKDRKGRMVNGVFVKEV